MPNTAIEVQPRSTEVVADWNSDYDLVDGRYVGSSVIEGLCCLECGCEVDGYLSDWPARWLRGIACSACGGYLAAWRV